MRIWPFVTIPTMSLWGQGGSFISNPWTRWCSAWPDRLGNPKHWMPVCCIPIVYLWNNSKALPFQNKCLAPRYLTYILLTPVMVISLIMLSCHALCIPFSVHFISWNPAVNVSIFDRRMKNIFWSLPRIYFISAKCFPPYRISCVTLFLNMVTPCSEMYEPVADHFPCNDCRIILIYRMTPTGRSAMCYLQWSKTI